MFVTGQKLPTELSASKTYTSTHQTVTYEGLVMTFIKKSVVLALTALTFSLTSVASANPQDNPQTPQATIEGEDAKALFETLSSSGARGQGLIGATHISASKLSCSERVLNGALLTACLFEQTVAAPNTGPDARLNFQVSGELAEQFVQLLRDSGVQQGYFRDLTTYYASEVNCVKRVVGPEFAANDTSCTLFL